MTARGARRALWIVLLFTLPVPYYLGASEWAPVARLAFFSALNLAIVASEGVGSMGFFAWIGPLQCVLWLALLYAGAALVVALLGRLGAGGARAVGVGLLAVLLLGASLLEIYSTPLSSVRPRSSLVHLFR